MNKVTRMLAMAGMGMVAAATLGAGTAQAAVSTTQTAAKPAAGQSSQAQQDRGRDRDRVVGYYRNRSACERAGRRGEWQDRWDDYSCEWVRGGFNRRAWALEVERDHRGNGHWGNGHWGNDDRRGGRGR